MKPKYVGIHRKVYGQLLGTREGENGDLLNEYRVSVLQHEKVWRLYNNVNILY